MLRTDRTTVPGLASVSRRRFLQSANVALGAAPFWLSAAAGAQPAVRPAPGLPAPRYVNTNGIRMGVYESGDGLPVMFAHGFPELALSWRNQIRAYPEAGLRAIAPDMRGYGLTDRPADAAGYTPTNICADLIGVLDALDIDRAIFCGHDWGGVPVWTMPRLYPDRVLGVIGVNTPAFSGRRAESSQPEQPAEPPLIVQTANYYFNTFQEPGRAEAILEGNVRRGLEMLFRRGWYWNVENMRRYPEDSAERTMDFLRMIQEGDYQGELFMDPAVLDYWVETFETTGFTGGLNYYRAGATGAPPPPTGDIDVPCLYVGADNDTILRPSSSDGMSEFIPDLERHVVADCGHWTQQEKPEEFNRVTLDWIGKKFGVA
jgi:pimeloyl-ACP methyl ester carboxylesterase